MSVDKANQSEKMSPNSRKRESMKNSSPNSRKRESTKNSSPNSRKRESSKISSPNSRKRESMKNSFETAEKEVYRRIHRKHQCTLALGSESMLPKPRGYCHPLKKLTLIAVLHPESYQHFISYPAILAERQRQLFEGGAIVIHPYSLFSLIWSSFMVLINLLHMITSPLRLTFILHTSPQPTLDYPDHVLLGLHIVCILDIIVKFNVGFKKRQADIVMLRKEIACHYLRTWFLPDIISCLPVAYLFLHLNMSHAYLLVPQIMPLVRCARLFTAISNMKIFIKLFTRSFIWVRSAQQVTLFIVTMHWCTCLHYFSPVITYYWTGQLPLDYCDFLKPEGGDISKVGFGDRYHKAIFVTFSAFFGTGYSMFDSYNPDEIVIDGFIILYAATFMIYTLVFFLKIYMTHFNSIMRYHELMNQMEKYMRHKQFSTQLKKRVRAFYKYRYQERYFKEEHALECLSEQLRNEITLHTCHKLVQKVELLMELPASVVGSVLARLRPEVYMPGDLIVRAGELGDCMYFIGIGTVAVYSLKGAEVCHLEDGAHFGEVALLMKDNKRVATVVAVEITQVHRLDAADFRDFVMTYEELYKRVEVLASKRMHETVLIDEAFSRTKLTG